MSVRLREAFERAIEIAVEEERRYAAISEQTTDLYKSNEAQAAADACRLIANRLREISQGA